MRKWGRMVALVVLGLGLAGTSACTVGDAPVEANAGDLIFYRNFNSNAGAGPARVAILDKFVPQPFQHVDFSRSELLSTLTNTRLPELGFDPAGGSQLVTDTIDVTYGTFRGDITRQQEVMLFTRQPEEMFNALTNTLDGSVFATQARPTRLPGALTFEYPAMVGQVGPSEVDHIIDADFWGNTKPSFAIDDQACTLFNPSFQDGNQCGSIKSAKVIQHGSCSAEQAFTPILTTVTQSLWDLFEGAMYSQSACLAPQRDWDQAVSFVRTTIDDEESQLGGFILNAAFGDHDFHTGTKDDHLRVNEAFWLRLKDGRLFAEAKTNGTYQTGSNGPDFYAYGLDALNTVVGQKIFEASDDAQVFPGAACVQRKANDSTLSPDDAASDCGSFISTFLTFLQNAPDFQALTPNEQRIVKDNLMHTTRANQQSERVFDNFRCRAPKSAPSSPQCEFIVRAKRLNVMPDSVELVFLDGDHDITAPAWPLFARGGPFQEGLCSRQPRITAPGNPQNFIRPFSFVDLGAKNDKALCQKSPNTCFVECFL